MSLLKKSKMPVSDPGIYILLLMVVLLLLSPARAQTTMPQNTQAGPDYTLLDRLILGAGREKVATDTPQSVTVLDQESLDQEQPVNITDILRRVPNAQIIGGANRALGQSFNIRGIGKGESAADEGRIIVNVDGVPQFYEQYRMGGFFNDPELFKHVEVLRGPASSTLYGSGALGGVVNFMTKDAADFLKDDRQATLKLKSSYDSNPKGYLHSALLAQRLGQNVDILLSGNYRKANPFTDGGGNSISGSQFTTPNGMAKATIYLDDHRERVLRASYSQFTSDQNNQAYSQLQPSGAFGSVDRIVNNRQAQFSYNDPAIDNPWLDIKFSFSYNNIANRQRNASSGFTSIFQDSDYAYETIQALGENRIEFSGETWENHLTFGGQLINQQRKTGTATALGFHPEGTDFQTGIFLQNEFIWDNRLTLIPGLRLDYQQLKAASSVASLNAGAAPGRQRHVAISPKIAALYKLNDRYSIFGSYAHTQRLPSLDEIYSNDFRYPAPPNYSLSLKKERSDNFEIGFVYSGADIFSKDDQFDIKTTGFYNRVKDLIVRTRRVYPQYTNVGRAELYGFEVEASYINGNYFADSGFAYTRGTDLTNRKALTTVAPPEITFGFGYRMPQRGLTFGYNGRFVAAEKRVPIPGSTPQAPVDLLAEKLKRAAFSTHDIYANWKPGEENQLYGWEAAFRVENIFDKRYRHFLANDNGKGRTFKLTLAKQFSW